MNGTTAQPGGKQPAPAAPALPSKVTNSVTESNPPAPVETVPEAAQGIKPRAPKLVVAPGAKPEPAASGIRPRGRGGRFRRGDGGSSSGSSSGGGLDKFEEGRLQKYENEAAQSRARAEAARADGNDAEGAAHDRAAQVAEETANRLKAKGGGSQRSTARPAASKRSDPLGLFN